MDDLAVAAHGSIESLQVAVHHEDQVVELLSAGQRNRAERFGFVALAVAHEGPHAALAGVVKAAVVKVAIEPGLIQRGERAEAHADRGELPEIGHQAGVRIATEAASVASDFTAEVVEIVFAEAAFEKRSGVYAGSSVTLKVHMIAGHAVVFAAEKMVEANLVEAGAAGKRREVTTHALSEGVGAHDHHRCVPADVGAYPLFEVAVSGEPGLALARDGVHIRRAHGGREAHLAGLSVLEQLAQQVAGSGFAVHIDDGVEAVEPFLRFAGIGIGELVDESVKSHGT